MSTVLSENIREPKITVTPPAWVKALAGFIFILIFVGIIFAPIDSALIKLFLLGLYCIFLLVVISNLLKGNYLVTMQANRDGVYFQTSEAKVYFFVPWSHVGEIEKTIFPLNARGIRVEVTGDYMGVVKSSDQIGNVREIENSLYIYTIPQLNDRDKLIEKLLALKSR